MNRPKLRPKGIFCLEGDWWTDLKRPSTVEPLLSIIDQRLTFKYRHIHRDIGTPEELEYYLEKWKQKGYAKYPILYLGFHGTEGHVFIGDQRRPANHITLEWLERRLAGSCAKQIIHFSSCSTLRLHGNTINAFLRATGALAVSGYRADIDWYTSAAFELLVLTEFQYGALTVSGAEGMLRRISEAAKGLVNDLDFRMAIRDASWESPKVSAASAS